MKSNFPKVLHELCGRPMIAYVCETVCSLKKNSVTVVLGHEFETVRKVLVNDVKVVRQKKLLGTADAVRQSVKSFPAGNYSVLIVCGDTPLLRKATLERLVAYHRQMKNQATCLTACVEKPQGYGRIIRGLNQDVLAICEERDATSRIRKINEINTGIYCFEKSCLVQALRSVKLNHKKKEFYLTDVIEIMVKNGLCVKALRLEDSREGMGINTREDLARADRLMQERILRSYMLKGVTIRNPATTFIDASAKIGRETIIHPFCVIGKDVRIGARCEIGPFCHLREGARIGRNVCVGNFAEICRSQLGDNSFMKHFSYLGDTLAGKRVNIGAGVVTANFDGKKKSQTQIGDEAFIGSDSILIAPIKIGKKAVTGAGSVVLKGRHVSAGQTVVGYPARVLTRRKKS